MRFRHFSAYSFRVLTKRPLAPSSNPTSEGGRARVSREVRGEVVRGDELPELPCAHCRELTASVFLVYADVSTSLPFAGEVCERCAAELAAEQGESAPTTLCSECGHPAHVDTCFEWIEPNGGPCFCLHEQEARR